MLRATAELPVLASSTMGALEAPPLRTALSADAIPVPVVWPQRATPSPSDAIARRGFASVSAGSGVMIVATEPQAAVVVSGWVAVLRTCAPVVALVRRNAVLTVPWPSSASYTSGAPAAA